MFKFIYFDVGGVMIKDFSCSNKWQELKRDLGIKADKYEAFDKFFDNYEDEICMGKDIETIVPLMIRKFDLKLPKYYSFLEDFVNRFEKNESIITVINSIGNEIKLGLLTNMYPGMLNLINKKHLIPDVNWEVIIDSSLVGLRKPQKKIYEIAQERAGVNPDQILFVENSRINIDMANDMGWNTFLYSSSDYEKSSQDLMSVIISYTG